MVRTSELEEVGESLIQPLHFAEVEIGAQRGDPTFPRSAGELVAENVVFFRSTEEVYKAVKFIKAKKSVFTGPHICASFSTGIFSLCHMKIGIRCPTSHPHFSFTQVMLSLEDKDIKGFTWAIAPALTSLGYLLILLVTIFPFWVRLVNEESREVFFSGLFENCFHIKCWKPRPLSSKEGWKQGLGRGGAGAGTGGGRGQD